MNATEKNIINLFALTDSHQETRKLCCLFSEIIALAPEKGKNTLICDGGDLFKGIYDRQLSVDSYLELRRQMPEAKIIIALGNNDFGFDLESFKYLQNAVKQFNRGNIHVLCANLFETETKKRPFWVDPYILLEIGGKKILVIAFCVNQIRLQKYGVYLEDILSSFLRLKDTIQHIAPDALVVINHALYPSSLDICKAAEAAGIKIDILIGGHEHSFLEPDFPHRIYYPHAFSRNALYFKLFFSKNGATLHLEKEINVKKAVLNPVFAEPLIRYEKKRGLDVPVAKSVLNLERNYSNPCPLGAFIADAMQKESKADIAIISTGYICHALRYEKDKILTCYNVERAFSAVVPLQTVRLNVAQLKEVFDNAVANRYILATGNFRFLQYSGNVALVCRRCENNRGEVVQMFVNNEPLLNENAQPLNGDRQFLCAIDPYIGAGEQGFDVLRSLPKETLMKNNQLILIKDLFIKAIKEAERKYPAGSSYPYPKLLDKD